MNYNAHDIFRLRYKPVKGAKLKSKTLIEEYVAEKMEGIYNISNTLRKLFNQYLSCFDEMNEENIDEELFFDCFLKELMIQYVFTKTKAPKIKYTSLYDHFEGYFEYQSSGLSKEDFKKYRILFEKMSATKHQAKINDIIFKSGKMKFEHIVFKNDGTFIYQDSKNKSDFKFQIFKNAISVLEESFAYKKINTNHPKKKILDAEGNGTPEEILITLMNGDTISFDGILMGDFKKQTYRNSQISNRDNLFPLTKYSEKIAERKKISEINFSLAKEEAIFKNPQLPHNGIKIKNVEDNLILGEVDNQKILDVLHFEGKTGSGKSVSMQMINQYLHNREQKIVHITETRIQAIEDAFETYYRTDGDIKVLFIHSTKTETSEYLKDLAIFEQKKINQVYDKQHETEQEKELELEKTIAALNYLKSFHTSFNASLLGNLYSKTEVSNYNTKIEGKKYLPNGSEGIQKISLGYKQQGTKNDNQNIFYYDNGERSDLFYKHYLPEDYGEGKNEFFKQIELANVIYINHSSFFRTKIPYLYDIYERTYFEYFAEVASMIVVDEIDYFIGKMNNETIGDILLLTEKHDISNLVEFSEKILSRKNKSQLNSNEKSLLKELKILSAYSHTRFFDIIKSDEMKHFLGLQKGEFNINSMISFFVSKTFIFEADDSKTRKNMAMPYELFFRKILLAEENQQMVDLKYYKEEVEMLEEKYKEGMKLIRKNFKMIFLSQNEEMEAMSNNEIDRRKKELIKSIETLIKKISEKENIPLRKNPKKYKLEFVSKFFAEIIEFYLYDQALGEIIQAKQLLKILQSNYYYVKGDNEKEILNHLIDGQSNKFSPIQQYIPKSLLKSKINYSYKDNELKLKTNMLNGGRLIEMPYDLYPSKFDLPKTIILSASGSLNKSTMNKTITAPRLLIENLNQKDSKLTIRRLKVPNISLETKYPSEKYYSISGTNPDTLKTKMYGLAYDLFNGTEIIEQAFERLALDNNSGKMIAFVCSSYENTIHFFNGLKKAMQENKIKEKYSLKYIKTLKEKKEPFKDKAKSLKDEKESNDAITINELSRLGEEEVQILVFPAKVLNRRVNILTPGTNKSLIGELFLTSRTMPIPQDFGLVINYVNSKLNDFYEDAFEYSLRKDEKRTPIEIMKSLISTELNNKEITDTRFEFLEPALQEVLSFNFLGDMVQLFGRGNRGGTNVRVNTLDFKFFERFEGMKSIFHYWLEIDKENELENHLYGSFRDAVKEMFSYESESRGE